MATKLIVLAAGKGTRMKSRKPKVLHHLADKPLLAHVLDNASILEPQQTSVVIGHESERVKAEIGHPVEWVMQTKQLGTGHAVIQALPHIDAEDLIVIAYGDVPLTRADTFSSLAAAASPEQIGLLTVKLDDASGYGRIVRDDNDNVTGIVEHKDATPEQLAITEMNSGMLSIHGGLLKTLLGQINNNNIQGEYYLTDIFSLAVQAGYRIQTVHPQYEWEVSGVNSRVQLAELERIYQRAIANRMMDAGVTLRDPERVDVRGNLSTGIDVEIDVNALFVGDNELGDNVVVGANCTLINSTIGNDCVIHSNTVIENSIVGTGCSIGPFSRLRPGNQLDDNAKIGNFVELKNANIGLGSKVNHLSYVGDSTVGDTVNVGAGTITANYDGANKHRTVLDDNVSIGSNTVLVAPVRVGKGSTIGAGTVVTRDVSENVLAVARGRVTEHDDWQRPVKKNTNSK